MLQLAIINDTKLTKTERAELFLDIFGNSLTREKSQNYIDSQIKPFSQLITNDIKCPLSIRKICDFSTLKFKDRDDIEEIFKSWSSKVPYDIEKQRDKRLRHYYKENYDYRGNFVDWDFNNYLYSYQVIEPTQYRRFRQHGQAFESKLETYKIPNRTFSSYAEGKKSDSKDSCLVRGYWADTIISPYFAFGCDADGKLEKEKLFKKLPPEMPSPYVFFLYLIFIDRGNDKPI